jgi:hypothetical protein
VEVYFVLGDVLGTLLSEFPRVDFAMQASAPLLMR